MKIWHVVLVCVILGMFSGLTGTMIELGASPALEKPLFPEASTDPGLNPGPVNGKHGKVVVDNEFYDAGIMQRDNEYTHTFILKNTGDAPLRLKQGETSCKCTVSKLANDHLDPGGEAEVKLSWTPFKDGAFGQRAEILTNDPQRPRISLLVKGRVIYTHAVVPERISVGSISVNDSQQGQVQVLGYAPNFEITSVALADRDASKFFDVSVTPIEAAELKTADADAKNGFLVNLTVKPGLPLGQIHQRILLHTNLPTKADIEIPIDGVITGDVTVYGIGSEYDTELNVLSIGTVKRSEGAIARLLVRLKGEDHQTAILKIEDVQPAWLKVELGEAKENSESTVRSVPLTVEVPEKSKPGVLLGPQKSHMGAIQLSTGIKSAPQIKIYVSFAVED